MLPRLAVLGFRGPVYATPATIDLLEVLLPATTALEALDPRSREKGILAGANVVMPNLSPPERQGDYALYDGKPRSSADAARKWADLAARLEPLGRRLVEDRGDPAASAR